MIFFLWFAPPPNGGASPEVEAAPTYIHVGGGGSPGASRHYLYDGYVFTGSGASRPPDDEAEILELLNVFLSFLKR